MQRVIGAVASGDLSKQVSADVSGDMLDLKNTINSMVDQLNKFTSEVTRVAREVGTEGKLGQAAAVTIEVGGVWKDLTDNVNLMAGNLTGQVRNIAEVTTAVANGDLSKKITIDVKGEFLELKNTVNAMVDQLNAFSGEVTRVAREVGVEGKLGGQAQTTEVAGVWKALTDNVNQWAANLTSQVRAIAEVATAVTEGDLTRQVQMEASGEVAALKEKLNEMIRNLRATTGQNIEQDWLKTNSERFTRMLQGHRDLKTVSAMILSDLASLVNAQHGAFYSMTEASDAGVASLELRAAYGFEERRNLSTTFRLGDGLVGQCAKEGKRILLTEVPHDYVRINSGLGAGTPLTVIVLPILFEGSVRAVIELASFSAFSPIHLAFLDQLTENVGLVLHTIQANALTDNLLEQSQSQAEELRAQQEELQASNADLGRQAQLLAEQNLEAKARNQQVEESARLLEEKAGQLLVSSKYKSEFIANMSHELRTPLNSLLMLAEQLEDNVDNNMTDTQVEYARVIRRSGNDLLALLNGILDLAKVESGTISIALADVPLAQLCDQLRSEFGPVARVRELGFSIEIEPGTLQTLPTDEQRLRQILKNLLANAFKFTTQGDGSTARAHGGTGLGLSISRQLAGLLGGEITLRSAPGEGSTFTLYLPVGAAISGAHPAPAAGVVRMIPEPRTPVTVAPRSLAYPVTGGSAGDPGGENAADNPLQGLKVLVVDDDFRNLFAMTALLERLQAEVTTAEGGSAALESLSQSSVDLILMDIMMPIMDGYATIRAIRADKQLTATPIIAVTGKVVVGERQRCLDAGANGYVPKPVNSADLLSSLEPWLRQVAAAR
jgi:signal transduction histidine kinase/HAMP domain-containing protein/ActR/RegA family two-component response regulator